LFYAPICQKYSQRDQKKKYNIKQYYKTILYIMEKNHYKLIVLIIDSDDMQIYSHFRNTIKKYVHTSKDILTLFIRFDNNMDCDVKLDNDTLYIPGVMKKTIGAFKYCLDNYSFDFILRTNLSSFYNYKILEEKVALLEKNGVVFGVETWAYNIKFPSGAGATMSRDVIELCANYNYKYAHCYPDDVCLGEVLMKYNLPIVKTERYDYDSTDIPYDSEMVKKYHHFRVKTNDRMNYDSKIFDSLYRDIYGTELSE